MHHPETRHPLVGRFAARLMDRFDRQSQSWLLAEGFGMLLLMVGLDLTMPWRFSLFGFYCVIAFIIALHVSSRSAILFAVVAAVLAMIGEMDGIAVRGFDGYAWACLNRICGILFAGGSGIYSRKFREEMRQRLASLEHAKELERDLVRAGEHEQRRLGQDLHDGVCQTLAALDCAAECLRLELESDNSPRVKIATELKRGLSEATLEVRNLARGIYPTWNEDEPIAVAVCNLVSRMNAISGCRIEFKADGPDLFLEPDTAMHLYKIAQEALQNALRHANATRIFLGMEVRGGVLALSVVDNGTGSGIQRRGGGIGWRTMKYRAHLIEAMLSINSPESGGTAVCCTLPLQLLHEARAPSPLQQAGP